MKDLDESRARLLQVIKARGFDMFRKGLDTARMRSLEQCMNVFRPGMTYCLAAPYAMRCVPPSRDQYVQLGAGDLVYVVGQTGYLREMKASYWEVITPDGQLRYMLWRADEDAKHRKDWREVVP